MGGRDYNYAGGYGLQRYRSVGITTIQECRDDNDTGGWGLQRYRLVGITTTQWVGITTMQESMDYNDTRGRNYMDRGWYVLQR